MNISETITQWRNVVAQREQLEDLAKKLKSGPEAELRASILMWMDSQNLPGISTDTGTAKRVVKSHLEIADKDVFMKFILAQMQIAETEGRPLVDGLYLQQRPLESGITEFLQEQSGMDTKAFKSLTDEQFNAIAAQYGIRRASAADVKFYQTK